MLLFILKRVGFMALTMLVVSMILFALLEIDKENVAVRVIGQYTTPEQRAGPGSSATATTDPSWNVMCPGSAAWLQVISGAP